MGGGGSLFLQRFTITHVTFLKKLICQAIDDENRHNSQIINSLLLCHQIFQSYSNKRFFNLFSQLQLAKILQRCVACVPLKLKYFIHFVMLSLPVIVFFICLLIFINYTFIW